MLDWLGTIAAKATLFDWTIVLGTLGAILYWLGTRTHDHFRRQGMPYLRPLPFVGNTASLVFGRTAVHNYMIDLYKRTEGQPATGFFRSMQPTLLIRDPKLIQMVTVKAFDHFVNRQELISADSEPILSRNLLLLRDQEWRDMRATLSPSFTASKLRNILTLIDHCTAQMTSYLKEKIKTCHDGVYEAEMKDLFTRFANDVIATSAFGIQIDSLGQPENEFYTMGRELTENKGIRALKFLGFILMPNIMKMMKIHIIPRNVISYFNSVVHDTIKERQKRDIFRPDMLQLLMQVRSGQLKTEAENELENIKNAKHMNLTDTDLTAQAVIFFVAGFATVSTTMSFCTYTLAKHPEVQKRIQQEVDEIFEKYEGKLTYEAIQELKYTEMVVYEVLRLHPVLPFLNRQCTNDIVIPPQGNVPAYTIRKGETVWIPVGGLQEDPKYWDDPEKFDPERFSEENKHKITPYTFMPFGLGPRICIGNRFALMEVKSGLANLLRHFTIVATPKTPKTAEHDPRDLTGAIKGGFWVGITPRTQ